MPQITDADVAKVKSLVTARDIAGARKLLRTFDGPRAEKLLANLNERYPVAAPAPVSAAMPDPQIERAKDLIQKKKYAEAKKILLTSEDPRADKLLARINDLDEMSLKAKAVQNTRPWMRTPCLILFALAIACPSLFCVLSTAGVLKIGDSMISINDEEQRAALVDLCKIAFQSSGLSSSALQSACQQEATTFHYLNIDLVKECYTRKPNDPLDFKTCFVEKGRTFSGEYVEAAKTS